MTMDVRLKPFDFAAAVARAGLKTDGTPIAGGSSPLGRRAGRVRGGGRVRLAWSEL